MTFITNQLYLIFITVQLYYINSKHVLSEILMIPVTSTKTLGKVLRRYRKNLELTQSEAGKKLNLPQKVVSNIESGREGVHIATIFRYMSALGLEMHLETRDKSSYGDGPW